MKALTVFEHEAIDPKMVPRETHDWLKARCLESTSAEVPWIQSTARGALQVTNYVGVISAPGDVQIEVLPKTGRRQDTPTEARGVLLEMLSCLREFRHVRTSTAQLLTRRMPLWEVFLAEFLEAVTRVAKRGLRGEYETLEQNLTTLRGKLLIADHVRLNRVRRDRFFVRHDEFSRNRPENRLIHSALRVAVSQTRSTGTQRLGRELEFVFAEVPTTTSPALDLQRVRLERGMDHYVPAIAWAKLLLSRDSPLTGQGSNAAPSLLFPMELVFEAFVAKHLRSQLARGLKLATQAQQHSLVTHQGRQWFRMKPDLVVREGSKARIVLDTKWKLLSQREGTTRKGKYGLSQSDLYQLFAYGQSYLGGNGDLILVYPSTPDFNRPLDRFEFPSSPRLRLWVLPFDIQSRRLVVPPQAPFADVFSELSNAR